jgi:PRC-barrel domain
MKNFLPVVALASLLSTTMFAQTTPPAATPAPSTIEKPMTPTTPSTTTPPSTMEMKSLVLTEVEAKTWVDKVVVSSDGKKVGEVVAFARDTSGKVTEMHADIGGFLGFGETRVRVMPTQFKLDIDRVVLAMTAEQAKTLPKIEKQ